MEYTIQRLRSLPFKTAALCRRSGRISPKEPLLLKPSSPHRSRKTSHRCSSRSVVKSALLWIKYITMTVRSQRHRRVRTLMPGSLSNTIAGHSPSNQTYILCQPFRIRQQHHAGSYVPFLWRILEVSPLIPILCVDVVRSFELGHVVLFTHCAVPLSECLRLHLILMSAHLMLDCCRYPSQNIGCPACPAD